MNRNSQKGNAVIWILIAIALFAALGYAFTSSSRTNTSFLDVEKASSYAKQVIAAGNEIKASVKRLELRGCSDTEISFENNVVGGYNNPNAPTNESCHIYALAGGGIQYQNPPTVIFDSASSGGETYSENVFSGENTGPNIGTAATDDLIYFVHFLQKDICVAINSLLGIDNPGGDPPDEGSGICAGNNEKFDGSYSTGACGIDVLPEYDGKSAACIKTVVGAGSDASYSFYNVLIRR